MSDNHIDTIIFDLDGVLLESRDMHWYSLNEALRTISNVHVIPHSLHLQRFNGLPTRTKLKILSDEYGLDISLHVEIEKLKQLHTLDWIKNNVCKSEQLDNLFHHLRLAGKQIAIASNSVRTTVDTFIDMSGISEYVDVSLSNEDIQYPKPSGEIYEKAMNLLNSSIDNSIVIEDSTVGCKSALSAKLNVIHVPNPTVLTHEFIQKGIELCDTSSIAKVIMPSTFILNADIERLTCLREARKAKMHVMCKKLTSYDCIIDGINQLSVSLENFIDVEQAMFIKQLTPDTQ